MCGIVGYIGGQQAAPLLLEGLARLEHRGYDSAGVAVLGGSGVHVAKKAGRVRDLREDLPKRFAGRTGIGHTRWATHGPANDANAHPHTDESGAVAVVHNGIIDNAAALRAQLTEAGVELRSDTDTEVVAHLVGRSTSDTLEGRVRDALAVIEGTYGIAVVHADFPDRIVVARNGSPLIIGVGRRRCTSPPTSPRWSATPPRSRTSTTASWPRSRRPASRRTASTPACSAPRTRRRRRSTSTRRRTTPASTTRSCTRRCSSSRPPPSARCAGGSTSGSAPPTSAASTSTPARPGRSAG